MLIFDGINLEEYIVIDDKPLIEELPERVNNTINIPNRHGEVYTGFKYGLKKITIKFFIDARKNNDYTDILRRFKHIVSVKDERKLHLPDELDKYYYAVIDSFTCEEIYSGVGQGELVFVCFDPFAYSEEYKVCESENNIITVENNGTEKTYPTIQISFQNEAQFAQVTNWNGSAVLLGNRPNIDNNLSNPVSTTISDPCESTAEWLNAGSVIDAGRVVDGSVAVSANGNYITGGNYGATDPTWHGPAVRRNLGKNMRDFELRATMIFKAKYASTDGSGYSKFTTGTYANNEWALMMRESASLSSKVLQTIPYGTKIYLSKINSSGSWGYCTYNKISGWVKTEYLIKVSSSNVTGKSGVNSLATDTPSDNGKLENKMGRFELYGFDSEGQKLFKVVLRDSTFWYDYVDPEVWIGNTLILEDKKNCPKPKTKKKKDGNETKTVTVESGSFGAWNSFYGEVLVRRETIKNKQYWALQLNKLVGGRVVQTLRTTMRLTNTNYPKGDLNNIVIWFGQHEDKPVPDEMGLTHLKVMELNTVDEEDNIINFYPGDEVIIDCAENKVTLNGFNCMDKVDIGSEFFGCEPGSSQFAVSTDDEGAYASAIIQEKWL